mmetsp:Transcript_29281/g.49261  ORF Transcript_29281/g.49261 Transcript_29281/m.49261 type:complete len:108 (+) Transcript_29281:79-402(+)
MISLSSAVPSRSLSGSENSPSVGTIVGATVGGVLALVALCGVIYFFAHKKPSLSEEDQVRELSNGVRVVKIFPEDYTDSSSSTGQASHPSAPIAPASGYPTPVARAY